MADILIRNLSVQLRDAIKSRAQRRGHSISDEIKSILAKALGSETGGDEKIGSRMVALFRDAGPVDLEMERTAPLRDPPDFK